MPHRAPTPGPNPRTAGRLPGRACSASHTLTLTLTLTLTHTPEPRLGQPHTLRMVLREYNSDFLVSIERGQALLTLAILTLATLTLALLTLATLTLAVLALAVLYCGASIERGPGHYPSSDALTSIDRAPSPPPHRPSRPLDLPPHRRPATSTPRRCSRRPSSTYAPWVSSSACARRGAATLPLPLPTPAPTPAPAPAPAPAPTPTPNPTPPTPTPYAYPEP